MNIHHAHLLSETFLSQSHLVDIYRFYNNPENFTKFKNDLFKSVTRQLLNKNYVDKYTSIMDLKFVKDNVNSPINPGYLALLKLDLLSIVDKELTYKERLELSNDLYIGLIQGVYMSGTVWSHDNICTLITDILNIKDSDKVKNKVKELIGDILLHNVPRKEACLIGNGRIEKNSVVIKFFEELSNRRNLKEKLMELEKDLVAEVGVKISLDPIYFFKERCRIVNLLVNSGVVTKIDLNGESRDLAIQLSDILDFNDDYSLTKHFQNFSYTTVREVN